MTRRVSLLVTLALAASCAHAAPSEVLQRDTARVLAAKARAVASPSGETIGAAIEAKGQLVSNGCRS